MAIPFTQPRHLKEADLLVRHTRRVLHRRRDVLSDAAITEVNGAVETLDGTVRSAADEKSVEAATGPLEKLLNRHAPLPSDAGWRENVEVIIVALIIAIALRAYFFQPFRIPTGSMEPTLNGILAHRLPASQTPPNFFVRVLQSVTLGRTFVDAVSPVKDRIASLQPMTRFGFMEYTRIVCESGRSYTVNAGLAGYDNGAENLRRALDVHVGKPVEAGAPIVRGYIDTGDQVFVDKFTYNFRRPQRGDVFVFRTNGIRGIEAGFTDPAVKSQFYIKRLAGLPGDELRIEQPRLFINGELAQTFGFERVMSLKEGYRGYANMSYGDPLDLRSFHYLRTPADVFRLPDDGYFALGDNSFNSSDSRVWGKVPENNIVGRGFIVYWPFGRHWGLVR